MRTIHILCHKAVVHAKGALSYDFAPQDSIFWWDLEKPSKHFLQHQESVPVFCQRHLAQFRDEYSTCVHDLAFVNVKGMPLYQWLEGHDTLSHWWCSLLFEKHPHMLPSLYAALKARALLHMLEKRHAEEEIRLVLHCKDTKLHAILRAFCKKHALSLIVATTATKKSMVTSVGFFFKQLWLQKKNCFEKSFWKRVYQHLPYFFQASLGFLCWLWRWRRIFFTSPSVSSATDSQATVVSYFPNIHKDKASQGIFRSYYYENLHDILENTQKSLHWLLVFVHSAQYTHKECIALKKRFQKRAQKYARHEDFHFVEEFLRIRSIVKALMQHKRLIFSSRMLERKVATHFCLGDISFWPYFKEYWRESFQGWRGLERCLQRQAFVNYAKAVKKSCITYDAQHAWTLFPFENCPWERMLTEAMRSAQAPALGRVYAFQHSCVRSADFRYFDAPALHTENVCANFLPHKYLLGGMGALHVLKNFLPTDKIFLVEALRYAHIVDEKLPLLPTENYTYLYIITSYFPQEVAAHIRTFTSWYAQHGQDWKVIIKGHPHCSVVPFLRKYGQENMVYAITQNSMALLFEDIQAQQNQGQGSVLWLSNSTTVTLEAAHMGLPCMVQKAENNFEMCPLEEKISVGCAQEVQHFLQAPQRSTVFQNFFYKDLALKRWRALLGLA